MLEFCVYILYRAGAALLAILPWPALFALGNAGGRCAWAVLGKYRRLARRNVSIAFGNEKSPLELRRLVRRHFQLLGANLVYTAKITAAPLEKILERVTIENTEAIDRHLRAGNPVVMVLSHLANWELFAQLMPNSFPYARTGSVYQKLGNRFIDAHMRRARSRTGLVLFDRQDGFQSVINLLRAGGGVGVVADQHAGDHGVWTPFFDRLASTSSLGPLLCKRTGAALVAAAVYTEGIGRWRIVITDRFDEPGASVEVLTAKMNEIIEQQIRHAPEDWFWVHNRWKTPIPNFLLAHYKRGVYLPPGCSPQNLQPFRILVRATNWLGDSVMSIPAVRAIKTGRPDAHLSILAPANLAPIWKLVSEVDEILPLADKSIFTAMQLIRRAEPFDVAVLFPNSLRSALEVWLSGIRQRVGYRGHWRSWLMNQIVREPREPGPPEHHARRYLRIAEDCGADIIAEKKTLHAQRRTPNAELLPSHPQSTINHQLLLGLCPGAEYGPAKRWLPERFAEAATAVKAKTPVHWILFGTKSDQPITEQIAKTLGVSCTNRAGQTTVEQLIEELGQCRLLLTNDTGAMHVAALLGVPVVAVFGSTEPRLTGPLGEGHIVLRHQVECSPCFLRECPIDFRCMHAVPVSEVVDAVMSILRRGDPVTTKDTESTKMI
jgi:lipopolysaccharide heptosyltransferase II